MKRGVDGKTFRAALDKFFREPTCQGARVQVELPNGELDVSEIQLLENRMIGDRDTHRINIKRIRLLMALGRCQRSSVNFNNRLTFEIREGFVA